MTFATMSPDRQKVAVDLAKRKVREVREAVVPELDALQREILRRTRHAHLIQSLPSIFHQFFRPARNKGAHGGRGSAKSWSFAAMVIDRCLQKLGTRVVCVREVQLSLKESVKRLLEDMIEKYDLGAEFRVLNTHIETPGDGVIIFHGMQNHTAESIKSLEGYDIAWVEEAQSLSQRSLDLLRPTLRQEESELWFTWNPNKVTDPIDQFLRGAAPPPSSIVAEVTYRDNPFFPAVLQQDMEWDRSRDIEKYNHIWLGQYERHSEARVFKNWRIEPFETPSSAEFLLGGDFGFSTDPTVLVRSFIIGKTLFVDAEAYKVGCEIDDTPTLFDTVGCSLNHQHPTSQAEASLLGECEGMMRSWQIIADSARPETISYLTRHGYPRIEPAKKGPGSVEEGIEFLKSYDIVVHPRCVHCIDELTSYSFKKHRLTGEVLPVLSDKKNHVIDSLRYMVEPLRNPTVDFVTW